MTTKDLKIKIAITKDVPRYNEICEIVSLFYTVKLLFADNIDDRELSVRSDEYQFRCNHRKWLLQHLINKMYCILHDGAKKVNGKKVKDYNVEDLLNFSSPTNFTVYWTLEHFMLAKDKVKKGNELIYDSYDRANISTLRNQMGFAHLATDTSHIPAELHKATLDGLEGVIDGILLLYEGANTIVFHRGCDFDTIKSDVVLRKRTKTLSKWLEK